MLKQASVSQIRKGEISRDTGFIAVCMAMYPRGVKRELMDDFRSDLAPARDLFREWKEFERASGHDEAFRLARYEERFELKPVGLYHLKKFSEMDRDVFLVCQCAVGERCHREMLMLFARDRYNARIGEIFNEYPVWSSRIPSIDDQLRWG